MPSVAAVPNGRNDRNIIKLSKVDYYVIDPI
jgi:hypothetical protein